MTKITTSLPELIQVLRRIDFSIATISNIAGTPMLVRQITYLQHFPSDKDHTLHPELQAINNEVFAFEILTKAIHHLQETRKYLHLIGVLRPELKSSTYIPPSPFDDIPYNPSPKDSKSRPEKDNDEVVNNFIEEYCTKHEENTQSKGQNI